MQVDPKPFGRSVGVLNLFVLDRNTWNHITARKLSVLDINY